jgi:hypothetical protein
MKEDQYNPSLLHGLPGETYLLALCYGLADPWSQDLGVFEDYSVLPDGVLNEDGLELLDQARAKGWDHRSFFYYKRLGINWLKLESLIHLIEFTGISTVPVQNLPGVLSDHILQRTGGGPIRKPAALFSKPGVVENKGQINTLWDTGDFSKSTGDASDSPLRINANLHVPNGLLNLDAAYTSLFVQTGFQDTSLHGEADSSEIMSALRILNESELQKYLESNLVTDKLRSRFIDLFMKHGLFVGIWFNKYFSRTLLRAMPNVGLEERELERLFAEAYGQNADSLITEKIIGHVFWQMIFYVLSKKEMNSHIENWVNEFSEPRLCAICSQPFSPILVKSDIYYGSNGNTSICYGCIQPEKPREPDLNPLIAAFVESCGNPPPEGMTPIDLRVTTTIEHEQHSEMIEAWRKMGGIQHVKTVLGGSWFKAMFDAGCLPEGMVLSGRGIRCMAADGHECNSIAEMIIDNLLSEKNIAHTKEPYYPYHPRLNPGTGKRADWKIGDKLVEYFGLAGNAAYDLRTIEKLQLAREEGLQLVALYPEDLTDLENSLISNIG